MVLPNASKLSAMRRRLFGSAVAMLVMTAFLFLDPVLIFASCSQHANDSLIFPQIADGGGYKTNLLLTNSSGTATTATISFFSGSGTPLNVTIDGVTSSSFTVSVPAGGSAKLVTSGSPSIVTTGWASVAASPAVDLFGNAIYQYFTGSSLLSEASVTAMLPVSSMDFYADEEGGFKTGFALANPGAITAKGTLTLRRKDGTVFDHYLISVEPGNHAAAFLWEILAGAPSGRAEINLTQGYLAATALRYHTSTVFSTVSVGQPGFSPGGATALFSPGGGIRNRLVAEINRAQSTIDVAIYSFTANEIRDALIAAKNRGLTIRIIADSSQVSTPGSEIATLEGLGFSLKRMAGATGGIMHNKYMILDGRLLFTGSYNWSVSAEDLNYENAVFVQGSPLVRKYQLDFEKMWSK